MRVFPPSETTAAAGNELAAAALDYASRGWHVFPVRGKRPLTVNGLKDATTGTELIGEWWQRWPDAGVAVRTGQESGLFVLDVDGDQGADTLHELERGRGELPATAEVLTGGGGRHIYFMHPGGELRNTASTLGAGLDTRADGGYVVCPPSPHPSGRRYEWSVDGDPADVELANPPTWLLTDAVKRRNGAPRIGAAIPEGKRDSTLTSLAGTMRRRGMDESAILAALRETNARRCRPPLDEPQIERIAASVARYEPEQSVPDVPACTLDDALATFQRWLHLPDTGVVLAILATVGANLLDGDPVWLLVVGPPGGGKSEALQATAALPDVHPTATLTEPALLSGTAKRERSADAKGGLLRVVGDFGLVLCKDFGSVLSMHRDQRAATLAALREVYDGSWTRHLGVDGGKTLSWSGKVGLLAGCTQTIDRHAAVMGSMGERFVLYRLPEADGDHQARRALEQVGREAEMRSELQAAVCGLFRDSLPRAPQPLCDEERERLIRLATLVVRCRSAVERDGYSREVELVPDAEAPTRLVKVLARLLAGADAIGAERAVRWRLVVKAALDSIPALRLAAIHALHETSEELSTSELSAVLEHPTQTTRRALEDLTAHALIRRLPGGQGKADKWMLGEWSAERYAEALTVPDLSGGRDA